MLFITVFSGGGLVGKRGGMRPFAFPCNGFDNLPRCQHGGKGPRKTWTKAGRFCVCLCYPKWKGPECNYVNDAVGKRGGSMQPHTGEQSGSVLPWAKDNMRLTGGDDPRPFSWKYGSPESLAQKRSDPYSLYDNIPWDQDSDLIFKEKK